MIGETLSHFRITAKLGEGGMGEVYLATDTKLDRQVALKVLPMAFASDPERLARFEREAKLLAALNHPGIAGIHQIEEVAGKKIIVMELAEGKDLSARLARGPLPLEEALGAALRIAEALEAAHEAGIVHRDLKPANIMLAPAGEIKILDFGIAKVATSGTGGGPLLTQSPTIPLQMTTAGVLMGTAAYMSPEQARGHEADHRSDVWSFGAVLFEMLAGRPPFAGSTATEIIASVLKDQVVWDRLPEATPAPIRYLLERCLEKDARLRLQAIGEARITLSSYLAAHLDADSYPDRSRRTVVDDLRASSTSGHLHRFGLVASFIAGALFLALVAGLGGYRLRPEPPTPPLRKLELGTGVLGSDYRGNHPRISPDGSRILYSQHDKLWVRKLSELTSTEVRGSYFARYPCWSPDSNSIAFAADGRLWKADIGGGQPSPIAIWPEENLGTAGMVWRPDGRIVLAGYVEPLLEVSDQGGAFAPLMKDEAGALEDLHEIDLLPDGRSIVFVAHRRDPNGRERLVDTIGVFSGGSDTGGTSVELLRLEGQALSSVTYSPTGHLLFHQATGTAGVWAVAFDVEALEVTGSPFLVSPESRMPSVAADGTLLFVHGLAQSDREIVRVDRAGVIQWSSGHLQPGITAPALSLDGTKIAVSATENSSNENIWVYDLEVSTRTRLTFDSTAEMFPVWSPVDDRLLFVVSDARRVMLLHASGGEARMLADGYSPTWTPDGDSILFNRPMADNGSTDLFRLAIAGAGGTTGEPERLTDTPTNEDEFRLSPDGNLIAYKSNESDRSEIYVETYPPGSGKTQVSRNGGRWPVWSHDGRELFFLGSSDGLLMAARLVREKPHAFGTPEALFSTSDLGLSGVEASFAPTPEGHFLIPRDVENPSKDPRLVLVQNWYGEFE